MPDTFKHFFLHDTKQVRKYTPLSNARSNEVEYPDPKIHGNNLLSQFDSLWKENATKKQESQAVQNRGGTYLDFSSTKEIPLVLTSLENQVKKIELLNVKVSNSENKITASLFLPDKAKDHFENQIQEYITKTTKTGKPCKQNLISSITEVSLSRIESFWMDLQYPIPLEEKIWCEIWIISNTMGKNEFKSIFCLCDSLGIKHSNKIINFPDRIVTLCNCNRNDLQDLIDASSIIAEIHKATEVPSIFLSNQHDSNLWVKDLKDRLFKTDMKSRICILDTGINRAHPLLEGVTEDKTVQAADFTWSSADSNGHGTAMAGICEYFTLEDKFSSNGRIEQAIALESIKILPDKGKNEPELFGRITEDAVNIAQITVNDTNRIHCMAVTEDSSVEEINNQDELGKPSSWSAALDNITAGYEDGSKKFFAVSAGNVKPDELRIYGYPNANYVHCVESPAQAWNVLTVGAYCSKVQITHPELKDFKPVAKNGELCPFSTTSNNEKWTSAWPVKPEVLFEGGNAITDGRIFDICDDVSLLTTRSDFHIKPLKTINATSAATAQAAHAAARINSFYPGLWPETIRALLVHSAEWTPSMMETFPSMDKKSLGRKSMLHTFGYGIADIQRSLNSFTSSATMVIQDELQPFEEVSYIRGKEMNLHTLPWPRDFLLELGEKKVIMKVTLSYYIEASPDQRAWKNNYKYASCGLRFEVNNINEEPNAFVNRISKAEREDNYENQTDSNSSDKWYLGSNNRDSGSIHSDYWEGTAAELSDVQCVAVYPVSGWWKTKKTLNRYNKKVRYSLIISLSTEDEKIEIYNSIKTVIENSIRTPIVIRDF